MSTVLSERRGSTAVITLNSPQTLNALTLEMFLQIDAALDEFAADPAIRAIVFRGLGPRSFCAGGDVKRVVLETGDHHRYAREFFDAEYRVDHRIYGYSKPIIALAHGIVMGGGLGLIMGARCRVITENSVLAMPEISIGFYPDVGGTYFLPRLPGRLGLFLGLTAARLNATDALEYGFVDFVVRETDRDAILDEITRTRWSEDSESNQEKLRHILQAHQPTADRLPALQIKPRLDQIESLCAGETIQEIGRKLSMARASNDYWIAESAAAFVQGSPTSAALFFEAWRRGGKLDLAQNFELEYGLSIQCVARPDFTEGVRARLIDKDQKPQWTPRTLAEVTPQWVAEHFQPLLSPRPRR